jgi:hypothetical protein
MRPRLIAPVGNVSAPSESNFVKLTPAHMRLPPPSKFEPPADENVLGVQFAMCVDDVLEKELFLKRHATEGCPRPAMCTSTRNNRLTKGAASANS